MNSKKETVLVADDDPRLLRLVQFNLQQAGYRVLSAPDGNRALRLAESENPDLILLECHAARLSVERADLEWESRLVAAYHKLSKAEELVVQDADRHADLLETYNRQFHIALISGCNSRWPLHFHGLMYDQSLR